MEAAIKNIEWNYERIIKEFFAISNESNGLFNYNDLLNLDLYIYRLVVKETLRIQELKKKQEEELKKEFK